LRIIKKSVITKFIFFKKKAIVKEITILRILNSPFIVKCHEVFESHDKLYLVLEYLEGGELFDRIKKIGNFGEREACILFKKLMIGIDCKLFYKIYIILVLYIEILNQKTFFLKVKMVFKYY
jgi:serine/threonine protein kinase